MHIQAAALQVVVEAEARQKAEEEAASLALARQLQESDSMSEALRADSASDDFDDGIHDPLRFAAVEEGVPPVQLGNSASRPAESVTPDTSKGVAKLAPSLAGAKASNLKLSSKQQSSGRQARWVPDSDVLSCMVCRKQFGVFLWKHHCRACGLVVSDGIGF